jgi:hypothetical protein
MVVAFDEAQNTLNMLKGHRTDEKISELFARAQIIADTMEVVFLSQQTLVTGNVNIIMKIRLILG